MREDFCRLMSAARAGKLSTALLAQFPCDALVLFVRTFDLLFEIKPVMGELPDHLINPTCDIPIDRADESTVSLTWNLCEGMAGAVFLG